MVIVVKKDAGEQRLNGLLEWLKARHVTPRVTVGERQTIIGCVGDVSGIDDGILRAMSDVVDSIKRIQEPYKAVNRKFHPEDTVIEIPRPGDTSLKIGGGGFQVIAGPCSVESADQVMRIAKAGKAAGATMLRGGAFKPRTSPYAFQGLGREGIGYLLAVGAVLCWNIYNFITAGLKGYDSLTLSVNQLVCATLMLVPAAVHSMPPASAFSPLLIFGLIWIGIVDSGFGYLIVIYGLKKLGPTTNAVYSNFLPVTSAFFGAIFLGETISLLQIIGGIIVIAAGFVVIKEKGRIDEGEAQIDEEESQQPS